MHITFEALYYDKKRIDGDDTVASIVRSLTAQFDIGDVKLKCVVFHALHGKLYKHRPKG